MLSAKRKSDGVVTFAFSETKSNAPFFCLECNEEVILKSGPVRVGHFAHLNPNACKLGMGESDEHRRCKLEIFKHLLRQKNVTNVRLERSLGAVRPDVSAIINGVQVAIEVQMSTLSMETIIHRTSQYAEKGIYVLWLLQWTPSLDSSRYSPRLWEKWVHAAYFGRVYYWVKGLKVACYHFDPHFRRSPKNTWHSGASEQITVGAHERKSKRYRAPIRYDVLNLVTDFVPKRREFWKGGKFIVPPARLFIERDGNSS